MRKHWKEFYRNDDFVTLTNLNMYTNVIKTENLMLRPIQINDTEDIHSYAGDPGIDMMLFLSKKTLEDTKSVAEYTVAQWNMDKPEDREYVVIMNGRIIGGVNIERYPEEQRYWIKLCSVKSLLSNEGVV